MKEAPPLVFTWTGDGFTPATSYQARIADQHFTIGERYTLVEQNERSQVSHNHEFAWLKDAWLSLPERVADQYPTQEHLRKRALIQAGFYREQIVDAGSNAAAHRVAAAFRGFDTFAYVVVRGPLVAVRTAESQSRRAMGKERFQASKQAIMDVIGDLIGTKVEAA